MDNRQFLLFVVGDKAYGIDVLKIEGIERVGSITRVPKSSKSTIGVMNLRGNIVPVLSLRQKLGMEPSKFDDQMRIIVIDDIDDQVGILVDKVLDVRKIDADDIYVDEEIRENDAKSAIRGAIRCKTGMLVTILDPDKLIKN